MRPVERSEIRLVVPFEWSLVVLLVLSPVGLGCTSRNEVPGDSVGDVLGLELETVFSLQIDGEEDDSLQLGGDLRVRPAGSALIVGDVQAGRILLVSSATEYQVIAEEGPGPEEYQGLASLAVGGGILYVGSASRARISTYSLSSSHAFLRSLDIRGALDVPNFTLVDMKFWRGSLYGKGFTDAFGPAGVTTEYVFFRLDENLTECSVLARVEETMPYPPQFVEEHDITSRLHRWALTAQGPIAATEWNGLRTELLANRGRSLLGPSLEVAPLPRSHDEIACVRTDYERMADMMSLAASQVRIESTHRTVRSLDTDESGGVLLLLRGAEHPERYRLVRHLADGATGHSEVAVDGSPTNDDVFLASGYVVRIRNHGRVGRTCADANRGAIDEALRKRTIEVLRISREGGG